MATDCSAPSCWKTVPPKVPIFYIIATSGRSTKNLQQPPPAPVKVTAARSASANEKTELKTSSDPRGRFRNRESQSYFRFFSTNEQVKSGGLVGWLVARLVAWLLFAPAVVTVFVVTTSLLLLLFLLLLIF